MSPTPSAIVDLGDGPPPFATADTPLTEILAATAAASLSKAFNYATVSQLLGHYPKKHRARGELATLGELVDGEPATVCVRVAAHTARQMRARGGKSMLVVGCVDAVGAPLEVAFFSMYPHKSELPVGATVMLAGKAHWNTKARTPLWTLKGAEYSIVPSAALTDTWSDASFAGAVIPIYPAKGAASSLLIEECIGSVLDVSLPLAGPVDDQLGELGQLSFDAAIRAVHRPDSKDHAAAGFDALRWTEAIVTQVALAVRRTGAQQQPTRPRPGAVAGVADAFDARLPFPLTDDQATVGRQIAEDLNSSSPMHSLIQGEVGAGKTIVALRAMLRAVDSGGQAAMLAPTEVLAIQHYKDLIDKLGPLADPIASPASHVKIVLYTGSMKSAQAKERLAQIAADADIVVGTHALLAKKVRYRDLGLVVVDEQHRFGIEQRAKLRAVGTWPPHLLMMSATPIPRSVAMTVFGDLKVYSITQLPAGRQPVTTTVVGGENPAWVDRMWQRIREETSTGRQAFVVCPRIDDSSDSAEGAPQLGLDGDDDKTPLTAVESLAADLASGPLAGLRIVTLHGQQDPEVKDRTMREFAAGAADVMVATTVIEVGVNVPNSTVMAIMDADRYGISQLHQLRGRIGRGKHAGVCLLHTSHGPTHTSRARLNTVAGSRNGLELARADLQMRGEGDMLGAAQSGKKGGALKLVKVIEHEELIAQAREVAERLVATDPALRVHRALASAVDAAVGDGGDVYVLTG